MLVDNREQGFSSEEDSGGVMFRKKTLVMVFRRNRAWRRTSPKAVSQVQIGGNEGVNSSFFWEVLERETMAAHAGLKCQSFPGQPLSQSSKGSSRCHSQEQLQVKCSRALPSFPHHALHLPFVCRKTSIKE